MNFVLVLIGGILIILGIREVSIYLIELDKKVNALNQILDDERFKSLENLQTEVDELNYSYYEILDEVTTKLDTLDLEVKKLQSDDIKTSKSNPEISSRFDMTLSDDIVTHHDEKIDKDKSQSYSAISEKEIIIDLIRNNYTDQDIAKQLGIGMGKVSIIREIYHKQTNKK